jgi:biopolymer transport protein ExbD
MRETIRKKEVVMKTGFAILMAASLTGCATIGTQNKMDVVKIDADGTTYLNGVRTPVASLSESFEKDEVIIEAERSTPHDKVVTVLEEAREAGVPTVSFKTQATTK